MISIAQKFIGPVQNNQTQGKPSQAPKPNWPALPAKSPFTAVPIADPDTHPSLEEASKKPDPKKERRVPKVMVTELSSSKSLDVDFGYGQGNRLVIYEVRGGEGKFRKLVPGDSNAPVTQRDINEFRIEVARARKSDPKVDEFVKLCPGMLS